MSTERSTVKMMAELELALRGDLGEDPRRIAMEGLKWVDLLVRKNLDYGSSVFKPPALAPELNADATIRVRMSDKISRLSNLMDLRRPSLISSESIEDTVRDLGAYCLLWLVRPKEQEVKDAVVR